MINHSHPVLSIIPGRFRAVDMVEPEGKAKTYRESRVAASSKVAPLALPWDDDIKSGSVAVHYIQGTICYKAWWRFSTSEFIQDIKDTEADDRISAHLLIIDSPGGEVFGCHEAHQALKDCKKPVHAYIESCCASAAYWIAAAAKKIYASSPLTEVGSIGAMAILEDDSEMYAKYGIKIVEMYAHESTLKNKLSRDAIDGKTEEFITKVIDPMFDIMKQDITSSRTIPEDGPALKGEVFYAPEAVGQGLIDGIKSLDDVVAGLSAKLPQTDLNKLNF